MIKRMRFIILGTILVFGLTSCQINTSKWQTIRYDSNLSFKVPEDWVMTKTSEGMIFSSNSLDDSNSLIYMAQVTYSLCDDHQMCFDHSLIGSGYLKNILESYQYSNSDVYYKSSFIINGTENDIRQIMFYIDTRLSIDFIVINDSISTSLVKRILSTKSLK